MKNLLLNCDQVFDVLTRGPFPSGDASDEGVEHHLRACHECRQLAEALRPAVALMHEAVDRDQALDLPEYQGSLPMQVATATLSAERPLTLGMRQVARPSLRREPSRGFDRAVGAVRMIAATLLLAALGTLIYGFAISPTTNDRGAGFAGLLGSEPEPKYLPDGPGLLTLASLNLPTRCLPASYQHLSADQAAALATAMAMGSDEALRCCTECHTAVKSPATRSQSLKPSLVAVAAQSCSACHRG